MIFMILLANLHDYEIALQTIETQYKAKLEFLRKGDTDLDPGIIRQVKVYVASKRKFKLAIKWPDAMATKGLFPKLFRKRYAFLDHGQAIEVILNPLGCAFPYEHGAAL